MAGMIEVAKATVTIVPNMEGSQKAITSELTGAAGTAGEKAGTAAGTNMAKSIGKAVAGTAIAAKVGKGIADSWKEVDSALDTVAVKTGATGENLESLGDSMKNVASSLPTDFAAAGDAIGEVNTKFGLTGTELEELSAQFIKFATINNTDVSTSVDTVANTLAAFGQDASTASEVLDAMNAAGQATGIGMDELGTALQKNAATFNEMGMSVQDAAGLMATFNAAGLTTADASTALRTAFKNAAADGKELSTAITEFGAVMDSGASSTDKMQAAIDLFGAKAGPAIYNAFAEGKISAEDFSAAMESVAGNVSSTFEATIDPTDRFQQAMNGLKTVGAELVEALMPAFDSILNAVIPIIQKVADGFSSLPDGVQTAIVAIAGITAVVGPVVSGLGNLTGIFGNIGGAAASAAGGIGNIGSSAASAAGGAASAASGFGTLAGSALQIVALGAGLALAGVGLKQMADGAVEIGNAGFPAAAAMLELVASLGALMAIAAALGPALTAGAAGILAFGTAMLEIGVAITAVELGLAALTEAFASLVDAIGRNATGLSQVIDALGASIGFVIDKIGGAISGVLDSFANIIKSIGDAAEASGSGMQKFGDGIATIVNLKLGDLVASLGATAAGIADIAKNADGINSVTTSITTLQTALKTFAAQSEEIVPQFATALSEAVETVTSGLKELQEAFASTKFELNMQLKLPHFKMSGNFDAKTGKVPSVSVEWYAKAAEQGAIFSSPQLIGVGDARQPEMLVGEQTLYDKISQAVGENGGDVYVYIGEHQLDAIIKRSQKRMAVKSGVRA